MPGCVEQACGLGVVVLRAYKRCCTHAAAGGSTAAMLEDLGAQAQDDQVKHAACRDCHSFCVSQSGAEVDAKVQDALRTSAAALQEQEALGAAVFDRLCDVRVRMVLAMGTRKA